MKPPEKKWPQANAAGQQHKRPATTAPQSRPAVAQTKNAARLMPVGVPGAPPVYRPQPQPAAVQAKAFAPPASASAPKSARTPPAAPPVYRPQPASGSAQRKCAHPQPAARPKSAPPAPPVYTPNPPPKVLQRKTTAAARVPAPPAACPTRPAPACLSRKGINAVRQSPRPAAPPPATVPRRPQASVQLKASTGSRQTPWVPARAAAFAPRGGPGPCVIQRAEASHVEEEESSLWACASETCTFTIISAGMPDWPCSKCTGTKWVLAENKGETKSNAKQTGYGGNESKIQVLQNALSGAMQAMSEAATPHMQTLSKFVGEKAKAYASEMSGANFKKLYDAASAVSKEVSGAYPNDIMAFDPGAEGENHPQYAKVHNTLVKAIRLYNVLTEILNSEDAPALYMTGIMQIMQGTTNKITECITQKSVSILALMEGQRKLLTPGK